MSRFPMSPYPTGWYVVAHSQDVGPGAVLPMTRFGRELVCWRAEGGSVHAMDAHCPHLGAHVGHGGFVRGETVVCPFHHWCFDASGANVDIPYRDTVNKGALLAPWPVHEANGTIMVWYAHDRSAPTWHVPELEESRDDRFVLQVPFEPWRFRSHVQEVMENSVDMAHFRYVHGVEGFGAIEVVEDGPRWTATAEITFGTPRGDVEGHIQNDVWGMGINFNRQLGLSPHVAIASSTPIDADTIEYRYTFHVERSEADGEPTNAARSYMKDYRYQIEQDIPIWEHKVFHDRPGLATGEGPVIQYRRWAAQFYPADVR